jgi:hypothetical protein
MPRHRLPVGVSWTHAPTIGRRWGVAPAILATRAQIDPLRRTHHVPGIRAQAARVLIAVAIAVTTVAAASWASAGVAHAASVGPLSAAGETGPSCNLPGDSVRTADQLMDGVYRFNPFAAVRLRYPLTWTEDPFESANWRFQFQSLTWVLPLIKAWEITGETGYRDRALSLVRSWVRHNPQDDPASDFSWNDHSTAWRAITLVCIAQAVPPGPLLRESMLLHGHTLADPSFYVGRGNHALDQSLGLLAIGCFVDRTGWQDVAEDRINALLEVSVDAQGVTNEQAVGYQLYNYRRYRQAERRLTDCGRTVSSTFNRIPKMARLLAHATAPDGRYVMIGDTLDEAATPIPRTIAEFAATRGARGPRPTTTIATFRAGYVFGRTGWGESRPYKDEVAFSLRFGPPRFIHGHDDASSITLYGYGTRLLLDPGYYGYEATVWRPWFRSPVAHNLVATDAPVRSDKPSRLVRSEETDHSFEAVVRANLYHGVRSTRRLVFSRHGGYLLAEDSVSSTRSRKWTQLWHLRDGARPKVSGDLVWTRRNRGNVLIQQLAAGGATRIVKGSTKPRQGWVSYRYLTVKAAPVVEHWMTGTSARFVTLIVPFAEGQPPVTVEDVVITADGFRATITVDGLTERVVATADGTTITPVE